MSDPFALFAARHGLTLEAQNVPFRPDGSKHWSGAGENDGPLYFLCRIRDRNGATVWSGCYSVGAAHPILWARGEGGYARPSRGRLRDNLARRARELSIAPRRESVADAEDRQAIREAFVRAAPLPIADVLLSLQGDFRVLDFPTFEEWADEMGEDTDSRRAERIYRECGAQATAFRRALGGAVFADFMALEEEE